MRNIYILGFIILLASCGGGSEKPSVSIYKFDRAFLDKMVKDSTALYDLYKRPDGTLELEKYFLGDTAKYELMYDKNGRLNSVFKYDSHGQKVWHEKYYGSGQRKVHYNMKPISENNPESDYHGLYTEWYENGVVKEMGLYEKGKQMWFIEYSKEGVAGDTTEYEYAP